MDRDDFFLQLARHGERIALFDSHARMMDGYFSRPRLRTLIWEATLNCNLKCLHCVNPKENWNPKNELNTEEAKRIFREIAEDFDPGEIHLAITGGECTLRSDLVEMVGYLKDIGFRDVSCDSNGWLYGEKPELLDDLYAAGMGSATLSIDGLEEGHDRMRGVKGSYKRAIKALGHIMENYGDRHPTVISVVTKFNFSEMLEALELFEGMGVKFARLSPVVPAGRAVNHPECFLSDDEFKQVMDWLTDWHVCERTGQHDMHLEFIDDGWCGRYHEGVVRPWLFRCDTGVTVGCVTWDGKAAACPIINRELTVQGDLRKERFGTIWQNRYEKFRDREWLRVGECVSCGDWRYCRGGSLHNRKSDGTMNPCPKMRLDTYISGLDEMKK